MGIPSSNPHKVSIWILRDGSTGFALNFCLRRLLLGSFTLLTCLGAGLYLYFSIPVAEDEYDEDSLALLRQYMAQRMTAPFAEDSANETSELKAPVVNPDYEANLDRKVKLLVDEIVRVRNYERQLQTRAGVLESILNSTVELDGEELFPAGSKKRSAKKKNGKNSVPEEAGMGGSEASLSPLFSVYPSLAKQAATGLNQLSLIDQLEFQIDRLNRLPLGTPVEGVQSSRFGWRSSPFTGKRHRHQGLDIAVTKRTVVRATADGVVVLAGTRGAYGKAVIIDHGGGIETLYAHLSGISVKAGSKVCRSQSIGFVGSTGRSTGPHLHYEVRVGGVPKNPEPFIQLASVLKSVK